MYQVNCNNWDEVNACFLQLIKNKQAIDAIEADKKATINEVSKQFDIQLTEKVLYENELTNKIRSFVRAEKNFISKEVYFGEISKEEKETTYVKNHNASCKALKHLGLHSYIKVTEDVDKDKVLTLHPDILKQAGISYKKTDEISINPYYDKIIGDNN